MHIQSVHSYCNQTLYPFLRSACYIAGNTILTYIANPIVKHTIGYTRPLLLKKWDGSNVRDSDVIVMLYAKRDWNGALVAPSLFIQLKIHSHKSMKVIHKEVGSIDDINNAVKKIKHQNNRIKNLVIHAHGCRLGMTLGDNNFLHILNITDLKPALDSLEKNASIILKSCETGHIERDNSTNIAQMIASTAPHTVVFAPLRSIDMLSFDVDWQDDTLRGKFSIPQKSDQTGLIGKVINIAYFAGFYFSVGTLLKLNNTGTFKHYEKKQSAPSNS